jgi:pimeloyl-ACP methyl ester carboxylesterase
MEDLVSGSAQVNGTTLHYVRCGSGPAVILIHGFPQDWTEYQAIMPRLAERFTVIAIDLRGIGRSHAEAGGYEADNLAEDVYLLAKRLKLERVYVVGHDIGGIVTFALVRRYPELLRGAMILDAAIPGIDGWEGIQGGAAFWHVPFMQVPGLAEKLVAGREADFFGYFLAFGNFAGEDVARYVAAYSKPEQLHAALEIFRAFPADARANSPHLAVKVPLLLGAGEKSPLAPLLTVMAQALRKRGSTEIETAVIRNAVHYVVQDEPEATVALIERKASEKTSY